MLGQYKQCKTHSLGTRVYCTQQKIHELVNNRNYPNRNAKRKKYLN